MADDDCVSIFLDTISTSSKISRSSLKAVANQLMDCTTSPLHLPLSCRIHHPANNKPSGLTKIPIQYRNCLVIFMHECLDFHQKHSYNPLIKATSALGRVSQSPSSTNISKNPLPQAWSTFVTRIKISKQQNKSIQPFP